MNKMIYGVFAVALVAGSTAALAGEVKGPPTDENRPDAPRLSSGKSWCSFSGLNDTPEGLGEPGQEGYDPGGIAQSYGFFHSEGLYNPSDPEERADFAFPGTGCNPTRSFPIPG